MKGKKQHPVLLVVAILGVAVVILAAVLSVVFVVAGSGGVSLK
jgi:hypothetical protein